jgi:Domain of unknown function (DUF5925)/ATPase family associated with various cellular activities (AAA)
VDNLKAGAVIAVGAVAGMDLAHLGSAFPRALRRTHGAVPALVPRGLFVAEVLALGLTHLGQAEFRGAVRAAELATLGRAVLVRADPTGDEVEALLRLPGGELALIDAGYGHVRVEVAAGTRTAADLAVTALRAALAAMPPSPTRVPVAFWMRGEHGGVVRHREIDAPTFDAIAENYPVTVKSALQQLVAMREPERGRLLLWRGEPGTGKSHALRALAREWAPWCSAHFIMDPSELVGHGGAYILDVLTWDGDDDDHWRLLILEDAGELIAADARAASGQALSRLLNVADGLLGQGTRTLVLITTNEPVRQLHPATRRPGRCLADIEFAPLSVAEANAWLAARGLERRVERPTPVAELYGSEAGPSIVRDGGDAESVRAFGFGRALATTRTE